MTYDKLTYRPFRTITFKELGDCPTNNIAPSHWIPEHKIEECHPDLKAMLEDKKLQLNQEVEEKIKALRLERDQKLQEFALGLRRGK